MGKLSLFWSENAPRQPNLSARLFAMPPVHGVALQLGTPFFIPLLYINNGVLAGGNYPVQVTVTEAPTSAPVLRSRAELSGVLIPCTYVGTGIPVSTNPGAKVPRKKLATSKGDRAPAKRS